jgi:serine/threonine protein kinase
MSFNVDRVNELACPGCKYRIDTSQAKPLTVIRCPGCGQMHTVPARVGSMVITGVLGQGTGSVVYTATDRVLGRQVALKVMKTLKEDEPGKQSGLDEARALLLVDHPNVIKVYAIDTRRGAPCIIMEVLSGGSLKELMEREGAMDEARVLQIGIDIALALEATSTKGLLHLDVKPGNIMFDDKGRAKLLDFGYAAIDPDEDRNEILGTPYYVSPELVRQWPPDFRADIYSLGATLFHAVAGQPPFDDESIKTILLKRLNSPPPDLLKVKPKANLKTARALARMMEEDATDRHATHRALVADLEAALAAVLASRSAGAPSA